MSRSIEYTVEELDWPIDINQPWLGSIPTVLEAVVTIEGNEDDWSVTAVNFQTTLGREASFSVLKRYSWAAFHPNVCNYVEAMLANDVYACDSIREEFEERREADREDAAEYRAELARDDAMLERIGK